MQTRIGVLYFTAGGTFYMACSLLVTGTGQGGALQPSDVATAVSSQWDDNCAAAVAYSSSQISYAYNSQPQ
ncbi:MAG TPA: hypothetical protein VKR31_10180 [Rhizomicrobium sp.]|nr:hypothetical protein [Rhizomicrobium sp.]